VRAIYADDTWCEIEKHRETQKIMGDLAVVHGTGSGMGMMGLIKKQLESVQNFGLADRHDPRTPKALKFQDVKMQEILDGPRSSEPWVEEHGGGAAVS
jgi:hypothetical protein